MDDDQLLRFKKPLRFLSVDFETEGLSPRFSKPWQVGWTLTENGKILESKQYHLQIPGLKVGADAARITHFNLSDHNRLARPPEEVYEEISKLWFDESIFLVLQNFYYDFNMMKNLERIIGIDRWYNLNHRVYDTIALSKAYKLGLTPPKDRKDYIKWQFSMLNFKQKGLKTSLGLMCREFNIEFDEGNAHESRYDTIKTAELFQKLIWAVRVY